MFHKRRYVPINPQKYSGDSSNIVMRSSWETRFAKWCDINPQIVRWSSEETVIPYICPTDNKLHRYFIDFKIKVQQKDGLTRTYLIEIKPAKQSKEPKQRKRITKQYIQEVMTWGVNCAKWKAAIEYCKDRKWEFIVMTSVDGTEFKHLTENDLILT